MLGQSPMSQLSLRHAEYASLLAQASQRTARPALQLRARARDAYYAAVRRAYVRARASRLTASRATA